MNKRAFDGEAAHLDSLAARVEYLIEGNPSQAEPFSADTVDGLREIRKILNFGGACISRIASLLRGECTEAEFKSGIEADLLNVVEE